MQFSSTEGSQQMSAAMNDDIRNLPSLKLDQGLHSALGSHPKTHQQMIYSKFL